MIGVALSNEDTFWLAITYETIRALKEDYPEAGEILAASVAVMQPQPALGTPSKKSVRDHYSRMCAAARV